MKRCAIGNICLGRPKVRVKGQGPQTTIFLEKASTSGLLTLSHTMTHFDASGKQAF